MKFLRSVFSFAVFSGLTVSGFCAEPDSAFTGLTPDGVMAVLEKGMTPFHRRDMVLERIEDPLLVRNPIVVFHMIFERAYLSKSKDTGKDVKPREGKQPVPQERPVRKEYADFVFVPKDISYNIRNALRLSHEDRSLPSPYTDIFFSKYGFRWSKTESEFQTYVLYLGEDSKNYYFGHANLSILMWFKKNFRLQGGFPVLETLAGALEAEDIEQFTSRYAILELARYKNEALPHLKNSVESFLQMDLSPMPSFLCMKMIDTPEADKLMVSYVNVDNDLVRNGLFQAFSDFSNMRIAHKRIFLAMVSTRMAPVIAVQAAKQLHFEKELIPYLQDYKVRPRTFEEYAFGVRSVLSLQNPDLKTPHAKAADQIRALLMHGGDVPKTVRVVNVQEKVIQREERLAKEDAERIKPFVAMIVNAPETDLSILTALELAMYNPPRSAHVSAALVKRIRSAGAEILSQLPRQEVLRTIKGLLRYLARPSERGMVEAAYRKMNLK